MVGGTCKNKTPLSRGFALEGPSNCSFGVTWFRGHIRIGAARSWRKRFPSLFLLARQKLSACALGVRHCKRPPWFEMDSLFNPGSLLQADWWRHQRQRPRRDRSSSYGRVCAFLRPCFFMSLRRFDILKLANLPASNVFTFTSFDTRKFLGARVQSCVPLLQATTTTTHRHFRLSALECSLTKRWCARQSSNHREMTFISASN